MSYSYPSASLSFFVTLVVALSLGTILQVHSTVPTNATFKYTNEGEFDVYVSEYGANYRTTSIGTFPFLLCFYNTTPNAYILGLRMGESSESVLRWVWDANRGKPVRENAMLTFGTNGNLILADVDGTVAWQTGTANKGVVGLDLLPNGNLVLYDSKGKFIWQSFDHPSDSLFVGQSLRSSNGPNKLVSRLSDTEPIDGSYSYVLDTKRLALYYKSNNAKNPLVYHVNEYVNGPSGLSSILFSIETFTNFLSDTVWAYEFQFNIKLNNNDGGGSVVLSRPKYNTTYSFLRMDMDGNLRIYTYDEHVNYNAWEVTYALFDRDTSEKRSECKLPRKCGALGVCDDNQCVACPTPSGLFGWSKGCAPPALPPCGKRANVDYFKVVGAEHFTNGVTGGSGPTSWADCKKKCDGDCKCLGFLYREESSKCLLAPDLGALNKVDNSSHVAYIKFSK